MTDEAREAQQHLVYAARYMKDAIIELHFAQKLMTSEQCSRSEVDRFESALKVLEFDLRSKIDSTFERLR